MVRLAREIVRSPFYRVRPGEVIRLAQAKIAFARGRVNDPVAFLQSLGIPHREALDGIEKWLPQIESALSRSRWGISPEDGFVLYGLTRATRPEYVIETGVAEGVSTSFIGAALIDNGWGTLYSIDLPVAQVDPEARAGDGARYSWSSEGGIAHLMPNSVREGLYDRWVLILEDVRSALPRLLDTLPKVDLFFHDDLHTPDHMVWEYETVWGRLSAGGFLVSDDANYGWIRFCRRYELHRQADISVNIQRLTAVRKTR
ncbi:MAG: class I SAM-dependent methyltransferase [Chloroflexota bacterium]